MKKLILLSIVLPVLVFGQEWHMRNLYGVYGLRYETRTESIASVIRSDGDFWMIVKNPGRVSDKKTVAVIEIDGENYGNLALRVLPSRCELYLPNNIIRAMLHGDEAHLTNGRVGLDQKIDLDGLMEAYRKAF